MQNTRYCEEILNLMMQMKKGFQGFQFCSNFTVINFNI